jgi:hypothetical protein
MAVAKSTTKEANRLHQRQLSARVLNTTAIIYNCELLRKLALAF